MKENQKKYKIFNKNGCKIVTKNELAELLLTNLMENLVSKFETEFSPKMQYSASTIYSKHYKKRITPPKCYIKNCQRQAIQSHSISKKMVLTNIANDKNHLYKVQYSPQSNEFKMVQIGINDASVFPGLCTVHDNVFQKLDNDADFEFSEEILSLINYRTLCREIFVQENKIRSMKGLLEQLSLNINNTKVKVIDDFNKFIMVKPLEITDFSSDNYEIEEEIEREINISRAILHNLHKSFNYGNSFGYMLETENTVPVALSGIGTFKVDNKIVTSLINVFSLKLKTVLTISVCQTDKSYLDEYISKCDIKNENDILKIIESWLIRGSDNWFINPEYWNSLDKNTQEKVIEEFSNYDNSDINIEPTISFIRWNWKDMKSLLG